MFALSSSPSSPFVLPVLVAAFAARLARFWAAAPFGGGGGGGAVAGFGWGGDGGSEEGPGGVGGGEEGEEEERSRRSVGEISEDGEDGGLELGFWVGVLMLLVPLMVVVVVDSAMLGGLFVGEQV